MSRRLDKLSAGKVAGMYLADEITELEVPAKHGAFVLNHMRHLMERELQQKIDALKAVHTCSKGHRYKGKCQECEARLNRILEGR